MVLGLGHHSQKDVQSGDKRGRDPLMATGRGGAGNIVRSPSRSRDRSSNDVSAAAAVPPHVTHSGRGGAGNVRSPSRDPLDRKRAEEAQVREEKLQEQYRANDLKAPHSTGRGGAGNIAADAEERGRGRDGASTTGGGGVSGLLRSLSRSRSRDSRNGKESPNRSQSRPRASESSKLAQVDESISRSSDESSVQNGSTTTHTTNGDAPHKQGFVDKLASHLPGRRD